MCYKINVDDFLKSINVEGVDWKFVSTLCRTITKNGKILNVENCSKRINECFEWIDDKEYETFIKTVYDIVTKGQPITEDMKIKTIEKIVCQKCIEYISKLLEQK